MTMEECGGRCERRADNGSEGEGAGLVRSREGREGES